MPTLPAQDHMYDTSPPNFITLGSFGQIVNTILLLFFLQDLHKVNGNVSLFCFLRLIWLILIEFLYRSRYSEGGLYHTCLFCSVSTKSKSNSSVFFFCIFNHCVLHIITYCDSTSLSVCLESNQQHVVLWFITNIRYLVIVLLLVK